MFARNPNEQLENEVPELRLLVGTNGEDTASLTSGHGFEPHWEHFLFDREGREEGRKVQKVALNWLKIEYV